MQFVNDGVLVPQGIIFEGETFGDFAHAILGR